MKIFNYCFKLWLPLGQFPGCILIAVIFLFSQSRAASQQLINTTGNTLQNNSFSLEYSIGEISITTLDNPQNYVTQGLLQPILYFKECNLLKFIPNAFTPNRDNLNDCFGMKDWPATSFFELRIFDRWGKQVFKTSNGLECWNGNFNNEPQPVGVYVYMLKANTLTCGELTFKGTISLIR